MTVRRASSEGAEFPCEQGLVFLIPALSQKGKPLLTTVGGEAMLFCALFLVGFQSGVMQSTRRSPQEWSTEKLTTREVNFLRELAQPRLCCSTKKTSGRLHHPERGLRPYLDPTVIWLYFPCKCAWSLPYYLVVEYEFGASHGASMDWMRNTILLEMGALITLVLMCVMGLKLIRRISRGGHGTFEQSQRLMEERINETGMEIRDRNLSMPTGEQLHILEVALQELLDLEGKPQGYEVCRTERSLSLMTPTGEASITYAVRQVRLRSAGRIVRGGAQWEVHHDGQEAQSFPELALLMRHLRSVVSPQKNLAGDAYAIPSLRYMRGIGRAPVRRKSRDAHKLR